VSLGELACGPCERGVNADHVQLLAQLLDASHSTPERARIDPSSSMRGCRRGARFGVAQTG